VFAKAGRVYDRAVARATRASRAGWRAERPGASHNNGFTAQDYDSSRWRTERVAVGIERVTFCGLPEGWYSLLSVACISSRTWRRVVTRSKRRRQTARCARGDRCDEYTGHGHEYTGHGHEYTGHGLVSS